MIEAAGIVLFDKEGKIFLAQRPKGKPLADKWEFPGGKIEKGESLQECIIREIQEELAVHVDLDRYLGFEDYQYDHGLVRLHLFMGSLSEHESIVLVEHQDATWLHVRDICSLDVPGIVHGFIPKIEEFIKNKGQ